MCVDSGTIQLRKEYVPKLYTKWLAIETARVNISKRLSGASVVPINDVTRDVRLG